MARKMAENATLEEWKDRPSQYEVPRDQIWSPRCAKFWTDKLMPPVRNLAAPGACARLFEAAGRRLVEPPILQPPRRCWTSTARTSARGPMSPSDALRGEQMLRPDFTVPVVQMHMAHGAEPARYTYAGEVFRRQEHDPDRANEFVQVGYEVFDRADPAAADAEVFALIAEALRG